MPMPVPTVGATADGVVAAQAWAAALWDDAGAATV
jgi:hypothetical protein